MEQFHPFLKKEKQIRDYDPVVAGDYRAQGNKLALIVGMKVVYGLEEALKAV